MVALLLCWILLPSLHHFVSATPSAPDTTRVPDGFDLQGHRGARGLAPENTMPAFERALKSGVTTLEMDVVVAGDGTVVVSHEPWMAADKCRAPDDERIPEAEEQAHNLHEMTYDEIAAYDCGSLRLDDFPEQTPTAAPKPRLRDVIERAETYVAEHDRPPVFYNIEIKSREEWDGTFQPAPPVFANRVLEVVQKVGVASRTTLQSFDSRVLEAVHEGEEPVRTALLVWNVGTAEAHLSTLSFVPDVYSPSAHLVDADRVDTAHEHGVLIIPWTVNESEAMAMLIEAGVDGFITDYPNRAQQVLAAQGDEER
ncbi:MAG: glycerophosphodiester phosphodiesterase [Bacteroidetes bacterium SW_9_63_38]|nr:MAG: glycerophosphodiester phosphodiesterase [Bacteroidetes bacterium SW_9_63_38]